MARRVRKRAAAYESRVRETVRIDARQLDLLKDQLVTALAPAPQPQSASFGELAEAWLRRIARHRVEPENERRHVEHLKPLAELRAGELTKGAIDDLFGRLFRDKKLGPATINKLRSAGRLIIRDGQGNGEWPGLNPFDLVARMKVPETVYNTFTLEEVGQVLPHLREDRRRLAKTVLLTGMRPGEALGLKKVDVDLKNKMVHIRRSHGRGQTKTGRERRFPIPEALLGDLKEQMATPGPFVFPKPDGKRQERDTKLTRILRTAIKKAGLITGYRYICRRKDCGYRVEETDLDERARCPYCDFKLWIEGIPRQFRFYDLRHSSATLHWKAKCDPLVVRTTLGHASHNSTDRYYAHLDEEYQRAELNKLKLPVE